VNHPWLKRIFIGCLLIGVGVLFSFGFFMAWVKWYPEDYDPKNIDYVLWKHGLNKNMNLDHAVGGMTHDTWALRRVEGLTKEQLKSRFGNIRTLDEAASYLKFCYTNGQAVGERGIRTDGKEVVFLRDSAWMVIMDKGKAVDLVLCKGY
jgi:hypothetical protein